MIKKTIAALCAFVLVAALIPTIALAESSEGGFYVVDKTKGDSATFANIILGTNPDEWPFASGVAEKSEFDVTAPAFVPARNVEYRLTFNVTSTGATGFRVRWFKDNTYNGFTSDDAAIVNDHVRTADQIATVIPAYFQNTIEAGETKTYTVDFKIPALVKADGLTGNVGIRGQQGSSDFSINWIKVEKKNGEVVAEWPLADAGTAPVEEPADEPVDEPADEPVVDEPVEEPVVEEPVVEAPVEEPAPAAPEPAPASDNPDTADNSQIAIAMGIMLCAGLGFMGLRKRAKDAV